LRVVRSHLEVFDGAFELPVVMFQWSFLPHSQ
jgi:hypothetical protein